MKWQWAILAMGALVLSCAPPETETPAASETPATGAALGIRAVADEEIQPDLSRIPDELKRVFDQTVVATEALTAFLLERLGMSPRTSSISIETSLS